MATTTKKETADAKAAADRIKAAARNAAKGLSRAQAERAAAAAVRNVNAYGQKEEGPSRWQERKEAKRQMYLMSTEKAVKLGVRKESKVTVKGSVSFQQCQKCFQVGHWTFECKNTRVYVSRPSRTQQLKNPKLRQPLQELCDPVPTVEGLEAKPDDEVRPSAAASPSKRMKGERSGTPVRKSDLRNRKRRRSKSSSDYDSSSPSSSSGTAEEYSTTSDEADSSSTYSSSTMSTQSRTTSSSRKSSSYSSQDPPTPESDSGDKLMPPTTGSEEEYRILNSEASRGRRQSKSKWSLRRQGRSRKKAKK